MADTGNDQSHREGRPLRLDGNAESADSSLPAFLSRPEGAPVYHGFPLLKGVEVDGFQLGMITDFLDQQDTVGDAFVIAPDGSRAGLVWESEVDTSYFEEIRPPEEDRWGVWAVGLPLPMRTVKEAREYLGALVPDLRRIWENWSSPKRVE
jgi:hypothetical protein